MKRPQNIFLASLSALFTFTGCSLDRGSQSREFEDELFSKRLKCSEVADRFVKSQELEVLKYRVFEVHYSRTLATCLLKVRVTALNNSGGLEGSEEQVVDALARRTLASVGSFSEFGSDEAFIRGKGTSGVTALEATAEMNRLLELD